MFARLMTLRFHRYLEYKSLFLTAEDAEEPARRHECFPLLGDWREAEKNVQRAVVLL